MQKTRKGLPFPRAEVEARPGELTAFVDRLVGKVSTVIVHVALPALRDAAAVVTPELAGLAGPAATVRALFIRVVLAIVHRVTLPGLWDTALVGTLPLVGFTPVMLCKPGIQLPGEKLSVHTGGI